MVYTYLLVKLEHPLFSLTAHGSINKVVTYSRRQGKNIVRQYNKPTGIASGAQTTQRTAFKGIITEWNALTSNEKSGWGAIAFLLHPLSGYNIFLGRPSKKRKVRMFGNAKFSRAVFGSPSL